jgi:hypothetical protein
MMVQNEKYIINEIQMLLSSIEELEVQMEVVVVEMKINEKHPI